MKLISPPHNLLVFVNLLFTNAAAAAVIAATTTSAAASHPCLTCNGAVLYLSRSNRLAPTGSSQQNVGDSLHETRVVGGLHGLPHLI